MNGTPSDDEIVSDSINGWLCCFVSRTFLFFALAEWRRA